MTPRVALSVCLLAVSGCGDAPSEVIDAGAMSLLIDVAAVDGGVPRDTRSPDVPAIDAVIPGDTRSPDVPSVDAGAPDDTRSPDVRTVDSAVPGDAGAPDVRTVDSGSPLDVIGSRDAVTARDLGASLDVGVSRDAGSAIDAPAPVDAGPCVYEAVYRDGEGDPRNAAGQIRECWPGEALCFCDRDDDCYRQQGYVPRCSPGIADAGSPTDLGASRDLPSRNTGAGRSSDPVDYRGAFPGHTGRRTVTIEVLGHARRVVVYVPPAPAASPALLLLFHGTNGTGDAVFAESDAQAVAMAHGAIVVAPDSRYRSSGDWDHRTEETFWETWPNVDSTANEDLLLTRALIVEARRAYGVDARRVYALGHSNGAFFATLVASVLADRIAAFATSSGGLNRCASTWSCSFEGSGSTCAVLRTRSGWCSCSGPEKPGAIRADGMMPPGYLAHGTRDPLVSVQYTCELEARMRAVGAVTQTALRDGDGHVLPSDFVSSAWRFLGSRRR